MKKISILVAVVSTFIVGLTRAQEVYYGESFELNSPLTPNQSIEYKANDFIHLKKGFQSLPQSPNYAMMEIDPYFNPETPYGLTYWKPDDFSNYISQGRLGFYPMDFDVNENGAAVISMPLEFPEGINGMTPLLSLNYNSQGGNGILGLGWSLGGMSKISRVPYTYMYDDSCHAVQFSNTDELSLDGVVLRKGKKDNVVCYYPEIYDYSIVYPINGNINNGFRVLKKDGNVYTYDAKYCLQSPMDTPIEWHLSRVEDPFGNYIEYNYQNDRIDGAFYPTSIRYTGHTGLLPKYEIKFEYASDERNDCPPKFFSKPDALNNSYGFSRITKKINSIQCWYEDCKIMSYNLTYFTKATDWNIRMLSSVEKQFFDNRGAKWSYNLVIPTEFQWRVTDYQLQYETAGEEVGLGTNYDASNQWYQYTAFAARFKHDNASGQQKHEHDIVHLMQKEDGYPPYYHLNVLHSDNMISQDTQQYGYNGNGFFYNCASFNQNNGFFSDGRTILAFMPADTDGDGLNEIVCVSFYVPGTVKVTLIKNQSDVFHEETAIPSLSCSSAGDFTDFTVGDFDGDGLSDLFFMFLDRPMAYMSTQSHPFSEQVTYDDGSFGVNRKTVIGDFNGDKKDQIIIIEKQSSGNYARNAWCLRVKQTSGNSGVHYSFSCHDILEDISVSYFSLNNICRRLCSGDFNGDGKQDILLLCDSGWRFYFSKGNGVFSEAMINTSFSNDNYAMTNESETSSPAFTFVTDLDNDGCDDIGVLKLQLIHDNTYRGIFRRDFLVRPNKEGVQVHCIKNTCGQNGADRCIDSIETNTSYYAEHTPFVPILGNHKGIAPNEIMTCRLGHRNGICNLGVFLRNTGCLENPPVRAISKIVTSLGATTDIEYRPVSYQFLQNEDYGREDEFLGENNRDLTPVLPYYGYMNIVEKVMTEMNDTEATGPSSPKTFRKTRYYFSRPYYHTRGRGFLGFNRIWSRQQGQEYENDIFTCQSYIVDETYNVLIPDSLKKYRFISPNHNEKTCFLRTGFTYLFQNNNGIDAHLGQIPDDVFSPYLHETITKRDDGSPLRFEKEVSQRDGYGNVVTHEQWSGSSVISFPYYEKSIITYDNEPGASRWILGVPNHETLIQHLSGTDADAIVRHSTYQNDMNTGRHTEKCTEPGNEKQLTETYAYNGFGNLISTTAIGSGETRTESVIYSTDGRFPIAKTNALGHTTTYTFDEATGRTESITDPNGLTTRYHYDILGNLIQTEYPSGVLEDQSMMWVGDSQNQNYHPDTPNFGCPIYFTYSKRSGERESYVFYDQHNRKLREVSCNMAGEKTYVDYNYYNYSGLVQKVSVPYFSGGNDAPRYTQYTYDYLDRCKEIRRNDNSSISYEYLGPSQSTTGFDGQKTTLQYNDAGLVERALSYDSPDHAVASQFSYYGDGKVKTANSITYCYDVNRNPLSVSDPSLGLLTYDYNAFGELVGSTTPNDETSYTYDALGRMTQRSGSDGNSYWYYDNDFIGALSSTNYVPVSGPTAKESFQYDRLGQLTRQTQKVGNEEEWAFNYTYNSLGKQSSITYPSGKKVKYHYNGKGFMDYVKDVATGDVLWQANASDRWDNISSFTEGDIDVEYGYDPVTGLVNSIGATRNSQTVLDQTYHWTPTGNLDWRTDATLDLKERFGYDFSNRLTSAITRNLAETQTYSEQAFDYDFRGNITQKTGVGSYAYDATPNRYAVTGLQPEAGQEALFPHQEVTYTSFDKLSTLSQDGKTLSVNYGIDRQRVMQTLSDGTTTRTKRYFTPLYETVTENGVTKKLHYLTSSTGLFAIFATQSNGGSTMHYTLKDHQGNLTATIHGNAVERLSYDAWGRRRNPVGFGYNNVTTTFDRGYTLHEHYDEFDLINMNGRLYDPILGRMLSPDVVIQDEQNSQAYNRYSYCFNNPLRFADPSGYVVEDDWYVDKNGRIVWDDNVTSVANTPDGGTYIGSNDKDILKYYGLREYYDNISMKRWCLSLNGVMMEYDHNGNLFPNQRPWLVPTIMSSSIEGRLTIEVNVRYDTDEASGTNKQVRVFKGITFNFVLSQSAQSFNYRGNAGVFWDGKLKENRLEHETNAFFEVDGKQFTKTQIFISADNIKAKKSFMRAQIRAGAINGISMFGPRPIKMIWDLVPSTPVTNQNQYTFKYYFLYEK